MSRVSPMTKIISGRCICNVLAPLRHSPSSTSLSQEELSLVEVRKILLSSRTFLYPAFWWQISQSQLLWPLRKLYGSIVLSRSRITNEEISGVGVEFCLRVMLPRSKAIFKIISRVMTHKNVQKYLMTLLGWMIIKYHKLKISWSLTSLWWLFSADT